jgi:hypothetical protein
MALCLEKAFRGDDGNMRMQATYEIAKIRKRGRGIRAHDFMLAPRHAPKALRRRRSRRLLPDAQASAVVVKVQIETLEDVGSDDAVEGDGEIVGA